MPQKRFNSRPKRGRKPEGLKLSRRWEDAISKVPTQAPKKIMPHTGIGIKRQMLGRRS